MYRYQESRVAGFKASKGKGSGAKFLNIEDFVDKDTGEINDVPVQDTKLESRAKSNIRARNNIRRLALSNFSGKESKFITFTFHENVQDLEEANTYFTKFIRSLKNYTKKKNDNEKLTYLAVIEFQERGAVHYHMICNGLPKYPNYKEIIDLWRKANKDKGGSVKVEDIRHVDNVGAYIVKYMTKADADERLVGKKMYQCSKGLDKPLEIAGEKAEELVRELGLEGKKIVYQNEYQDKHTLGKVTYQEYNLNRL
ncbi:Rep protein [Bacillus megaterium]|nr:Rep protein [Priestia megaterium]